MMSQYDGDHFDPPAPVADGGVRAAASGGVSTQTVMLMDTGADCTLLPRSLASEIGLSVEQDRKYQLAGYDGTTREVSTTVAEVIFCRKVFRGRYALTDDRTGILGRDVLNHLRLLLDGPATSWSQE
jgi:predicted aspartyl protease